MNQDKRDVYGVLDEWKGEEGEAPLNESKETSLAEVNPDWDSVVQELVEEAVKKVSREVEGWGEGTDVVESKSRSGFIPHTDGGWEGKCFARVESDTTYWPKPKPARDMIQKLLDQAREEAVKEIKKRYGERIKDHGLKDDQINYSDLYDADMGDVAEALDETERSWLEDEDFMYLVGAYYYGPENYHNDKKGGHTLYVFGAINWEAPYYHSGRNNEWVSKTFTFNFKDEGDLRSQLKRALDTIVNEMV